MRTLLAAIALVAGCAGPADTPTAAVPAVATTRPSSVVVELAALPVAPAAPMAGYSRAVFLPHGWADPDGNGCDARRDTLARQAVPGTEVRAGVHHCVLTATIVDPYSGAQVPSTRADTDHVVALGDAWRTGAQRLPAERRTALANDPANLVATSAHLNRQKGDLAADAWLPPAQGFRCEYVARQVAVKHRYELWVTQAEHDAMARVLSACPTGG